jgi:hypothetical protein
MVQTPFLVCLSVLGIMIQIVLIFLLFWIIQNEDWDGAERTGGFIVVSIVIWWVYQITTILINGF